MARYFLASADRVLPGWLTFSTMVRALPLVLLAGFSSRCEVNLVFTDHCPR